MNNPYLKKRARDSHGLKAEEFLASDIRGRTQPGSGCLDGAKGDIVVREFLIESKSTVAQSLSVKLEWLKKIEGEALIKGKVPVLAIQFVNPDGTPVPGGRWMAVPEHVFTDLTT